MRVVAAAMAACAVAAAAAAAGMPAAQEAAAIRVQDADPTTAVIPTITDNRHGELVINAGPRTGPDEAALLTYAQCTGVDGVLVNRIPLWGAPTAVYGNHAGGTPAYGHMTLTNTPAGGPLRNAQGWNVDTTDLIGAVGNPPTPWSWGWMLHMPNAPAEGVPLWDNHRALISEYTTLRSWPFFTQSQRLCLENQGSYMIRGNNATYNIDVAELYGNGSNLVWDSVGGRETDGVRISLSTLYDQPGVCATELRGERGAWQNLLTGVYKGTRIVDRMLPGVEALRVASFESVPSGTQSYWYPAGQHRLQSLQPINTQHRLTQSIGTMTAAFPGGPIDQPHSTVLIVDAGTLQNRGSKTFSLARGDMLVITSNRDPVLGTGLALYAEVPVAGYESAHRPSLAGYAHTGVYNGYDQFVLAATRTHTATAINQDAGAYSVYYQLRPVWDLGVQGEYDNDDLVLPKYLLSNAGSVACNIYSYEGELIDRRAGAPAWSTVSAGTVRTATDAGRVVLDVSRECDPRDNRQMPASRWVARTGVSFFDITPTDYCTAPEQNLTQVEPNAVVPHDQELPVFVPPLPDQVLHGVVGYAYVTGAGGEGTWDLTIAVKNNDAGEPLRLGAAGGDSKDKTGGSWCARRDTLSGQVEGNASLTTDLVTSVNLGQVNPHAPQQVWCNQAHVYTANGSLQHLYDFQKTVPAQRPYFQVIAADIQANRLGWGTGVDADGWEANVMGIGFMTSMVVISSMAGFRRASVPASLLIFFAIVAGATYLEVIDIGTGILSGVLAVIVLGIFSVGFRRR